MWKPRLEPNDVIAQSTAAVTGTWHYTIKGDDVGFWRYSFFIGERRVSGKINAKLGLLAVRRVKMKIDQDIAASCSETWS